jgi:hypothetical protein
MEMGEYQPRGRESVIGEGYKVGVRMGKAQKRGGLRKIGTRKRQDVEDKKKIEGKNDEM